MAEIETKVFPDPAAVTAEAARRVVAAATAKLSRAQQFAGQCIFSLVLSGGSTPKALYELLAGEPYRSQLNWSQVEVYFGDERCVPPDHRDSNYLMAHTAMLSKLPLPEPNIHRLRGEIPPEQAAREYGELLKAKFHDGGPDMVLLGMGDDGHTASLFPGTAALDEAHHRCVANPVPQLNTTRLTMTYPFLNRAAAVIALVTGTGKAGRLAEVLEGPRDLHRLPIQGIAPAGTMTWLLDAAAAGMMEE